MTSPPTVVDKTRFCSWVSWPTGLAGRLLTASKGSGIIRVYGQRCKERAVAKRPEKVTLTVPVDLRRKARAKAILEGKSLSQVVRELLQAWLEEGLPEAPEKQE